MKTIDLKSWRERVGSDKGLLYEYEIRDQNMMLLFSKMRTSPPGCFTQV